MGFKKAISFAPDKVITLVRHPQESREVPCRVVGEADKLGTDMIASMLRPAVAQPQGQNRSCAGNDHQRYLKKGLQFRA
jgi:hypothetical protein